MEHTAIKMFVGYDCSAVVGCGGSGLSEELEEDMSYLVEIASSISSCDSCDFPRLCVYIVAKVVVVVVVDVYVC